MTNHTYDIFIAYHGDRVTGSEAIAEEIYEKLNGWTMRDGSSLRAYFHPKTAPNEKFSETPRVVERTPLFLLVVNKSIPRNESGQLSERTDDGSLRYLYQEINALRESYYFKRAKLGLAAKLLICDEMSFDQAAKLDPVFSGSPAFRYSEEGVVDRIKGWIEDAFSDVGHARTSSGEAVIDWTKERAQTWGKMQPPSRPSDSELEIYRKYFQIAKDKKIGAGRPKALILGSTVEFRLLAAEEDFDVIVVDYSKEYYDEISKSLDSSYDIHRERHVECDWCSMESHLKGEKFDIVIGDLSVGNVSPAQLPALAENVCHLLSPTGYWLGKSIYIFSNEQITTAEMNRQLEEVASNPLIHSENIYPIIMYPLSIYAGREWPRRTEGGSVFRIDFDALYRCVKDFVDRSPDEEVKRKFSIYLDESTEFDKKMPENFYIYSYLHFLNTIRDAGLILEDTAYSKEPYKNDFPLPIIKQKTESRRDRTVSIDTYLSNLVDDPCWSTWKSALSSQYFLWKLKQFSQQEMVNRVHDIFNEKSHGSLFNTDNDLNCYITQIPEESLQKETSVLVHKTEIEGNDELIKDLQFNYTIGLLIDIVSCCQPSCNLLSLLLGTLFKKRNKHKRLWEPYKSPWVSARICICLLPLYKKWLKKVNRIQQEQKRAVEDVIESIANINIENPVNNYFWGTGTSNHFDTSALCLEALYAYFELIPSGAIREKIANKINGILTRHVRADKIRETFIKYPIYHELIDEVCANRIINGDPAYKKLCGRIAWYTIIYKICQDWGQEDQELLEMSDYIAEELKRFWDAFLEKSEEIITATIDSEKSLVPQIIYCLKSTKLFDYSGD